MSFAISRKPRSKKEGQKKHGRTYIALQGVQTNQSPFSPISQISHLQRAIGNQAVQRLFKFGTLQAKLKIGKPDDKYEQEADRIADQIMRMPEPRISRQTEEEEEKLVQPRRNISTAAGVTSGIESSINSLKGGGQPLPESIRNYFEPRFGSSFSQVRVHNNSQAAHIAKSIDAKAFTTGKNIVFGAGQYSPQTTEGKTLLGHELTHVVQQNKILPVRTRLTTLATPCIQKTPYSQKITRRKGTLFEKTMNGIQVRFFLYTGEIKKEPQIIANLSSVTAQMKKMNRMIAAPAHKVNQLFIWTAATNGFRIVLGKPVVYLDTRTAINKDLQTVAHEMGHAVNYSYIQRYKPTTGRKRRKLTPENIIEMTADVFLQLQNTNSKKLANLGVKDPITKSMVIPVGLFMVDPWNWCTLSKSKCKTEHPWQDFDEFFASAFSGYLLNSRELRKSIAKYGKMDAKIKLWGPKLLRLLKFFKTGRIPRSWYTVTSTPASIKKHITMTVGRTPEIRKSVSGGAQQYIYISRPGSPGTVKITPPLIWLVDPKIFKAIKVYTPKPGYIYRPTRPGSIP
jgi:hypothetical protein